MSDRTLQDWIGELTAAGFDIIGTAGHTSRGDGWNANHPMPSITIHLRSEKLDVIVKAYATNSRHWTVYGSAFSGKAPNLVFGFAVRGTKETALEFEDLESLA